jgi:serine/threonine protein kinase
MSTTKELIGTQLGRYTIVDHIATGGMAEIFLARQEASGRFKKDLVLKVLQTRWEEYPEIVELFLGEARISALMNHPNIVDVFDVAEEKGRHYIAMEHIAGKTLTELAKRAILVTKSISIEVGVYIAAEIASALAYMFDGAGGAGEPLHVIHRDISPTNVIISTTGQVKLIDFGIARQGLTVVQESGARPGKVTYMSPEQVKGFSIDGRSDIFCLGTILYEITLGRRLWRGPREVAVRRIVEERPKPPTFVRRDYPTELELIVLRALEKKPEDRYQSATELHRDLQNFLTNSNAHLRNNYQMADYVAKIFSEEADALISDSGRKRAQAFVEGNESSEGEQEDLDFDSQPAEGPGAALARALRASALGIWAESSGAAKSNPTHDVDGVSQVDKPNAKGQPEPEPEPIFRESLSELKQAARVETIKNTTAKKEVTSDVSKDDVARQEEDNAAKIQKKAEEPDAAGKTIIEKATEPTKEVASEKVKSYEKKVDSVADESADESNRLPRRWNGIVVVGIVLAVAAIMGVLYWLRGG